MIKSILKHLSTLVLMLTPLIIASVILYALEALTIFDIQPSGHGIWNDQMVYWLQSRTFADTGFSGGYYTANEVPAALSFTHFYYWGPVIPLFYGSIGAVMGWFRWTPLLIHALSLALATLCFIWLIRPNLWQRIALLIVLAAYPALLYYFHSVMIEIMNYAFAIALAASFYHLLKTEKKWVSTLFLLIVLLFAGSFRTSWMILIVPLTAYLFSGQKLWRLLAGGLFGVVLFVLYMLLQQQISAPYPNVFSQAMASLSSDFSGSLALLYENTWRNVLDIIALPRLELLLVLQALFIAGFALFGFIRNLLRDRQSLFEDDTMIFALHLYQLLAIGLIILILYEVSNWRMLRVLAPHVLFSIILLIATQKKWGLALVLLSMIVSLYYLITPYRSMIYQNYLETIRHEDTISEIQAQYQQLGLIADESSDNAWCNTVLMSLDVFENPAYLEALDPRMGVSILLGIPELAFEAQSRYVFVHERNMDEILNQDALIELYNYGDLGTLYYNSASDCAPLPDTP